MSTSMMSEPGVKPAPAKHPAATTQNPLLATLERWSDAGLLRHLDSAFARFIAGLDANADPALLVAAAMLSQMESRGHSCLPLAMLCDADPAWLASSDNIRQSLTAVWATLPKAVADWHQTLATSPVVQCLGIDQDHGQPLVLDGPSQAPRLYLRRYWRNEQTVSSAVAERCAPFAPVASAYIRGWLDRLFPVQATPDPDAGAGGESEPDWQKFACALALRGRLTIITGGPGTGKTYTAARLITLLLATSDAPERLRLALAAPTGKAAARLKQSIDTSLQSLQASLGDTLNLGALTQRIGGARTLHSLLGARPDTRHFRHHAGHPLDADVVIVDEASMVHLEMMAALLEALPHTCRLILLGDKDQLASVEAGAVLGDLCRGAESGRYDADTKKYLESSTGEHLTAAHRANATVASSGLETKLAQQTVMLRKSRRFGGPIGTLALAVNDATDPTLPSQLLREDPTGALFGNEGGDHAGLIELAVQGRPGAPASYRDYATRLGQMPQGSDPAAHQEWVKSVIQAFDRFRILCAVRAGDWGVEGLNRAIERRLEQDGLLRPSGSWYLGRPVMITRNDPTLGVFNGDIGIALPTSATTPNLRVFFLDGDELRSVAVSRLAHVDTAFAMTVHKSQGSEFEHTVLALSAHSGNVLTRELIYTGITRAREAFSLFAEREGLLESGVVRVTRRESGLIGWVMGYGTLTL